jgi:putative DNA primase/helicase
MVDVLEHDAITTNGTGNAPTPARSLLPHHLEMLRDASGISQAIIERRGCFSITTPKQAEELKFALAQALKVSEKHPALVIPYYGPDGELATHVMRPDNPRSLDDREKGKLPDGTYPQKVFKYEMVKGAGNVLDCHPDIIEALGDKDIPLYFTEGARKADSLISRGFTAINLNGVWGWRGTNAQQGKTALAGFDSIALNNRKCVLLFDNDVRSNDNVRAALRRFKSFLESRGAKVTPVLLPPSQNGKTGIDDWFVAGNSAADLERLVTYFDVFLPDLGTQKRRWTSEQFLDLFREWGYSFAINDTDETIEVNGQPMDDTKLDIIEARLMDDDIPTVHARKVMTLVADANRYHPIKDYLRSLKWDGLPQIDVLATYFSDEDGIFPLYLKRFLIGAVAKVMTDGRADNFMLALDGAQNIGKSHLARWLCPIDKLFLESPLNPDDKDSRINLARFWIWEVGELGSVTKRADREALKRFITARTVKERLPYGRLPIEKPAITSFIGTVNNEAGFLNDPTGNRRYAACTLTKIDWGYTQLDVNQIWAEAYHLYLEGESHNLTAEEITRRDDINQKYMVPEPLDDMIERYFHIDPAQTSEVWAMTAPAILELMELKPDDRALSMRLATVLKGLGLERDRNKRTITHDVIRMVYGNKVTETVTDRARFWQGIRPK